MKYDIHKDKKTEDTIKKIKNILKELEIETTETFLETDYPEKTCVRIEIKGTDIGTNGKGTCKTNALASGYGEFMERLQSQLLFEFSKEHDSKTVNVNKLENNIYIKNELNKNISFEDFIKFVKNDFAYRSIEDPPFTYLKPEIQQDNESLLPFTSIKTKEKKHIPSYIKFLFQTSNGYASGNTYEEAFVQALSEVCERYEKRNIILNQTAMPDVPYEYYSKYDNIINLINYIEENGYKIRIKDASCGELPVIITILEEKNENSNKKFCLMAGSHPCLSIAIERTLTEFLQGFDVKKDVLPLIDKGYKDINAIIVSSYKRSLNIEYDDYFNFLFKEESDYNFNPKIWEFNENITNKSMAKSLAEKVLNIADDIYIRNYNFLDFPTISLYIPKMSYSRFVYENYINYLEHYNKTVENLLKGELQGITAEDIYYICELGSLYKLNVPVSVKSLFMEELYLFQILSAILLKDEYKIKRALYFCIKQCDLIESVKTEFANKNKYKALQTYYNLKFENKKEDEIEDIITKEYGSEILNKIYLLLNNTTIEKLRMLINRNFKRYLNARKKISSEKKELIRKIKERLAKKYINNPPEQEHFIDFLYK